MIRVTTKCKLPSLQPSQIESQANLDLIEYSKIVGPLTYPLYPDEILQTLWGVSVKYNSALTDNNGDSVLAQFVPSAKSVFINDRLEGTYGQGNFSLAHEAGHVSLHSYLSDTTVDNAWCLGSNAREARIAEWQADLYASFLLMPSDAVYVKVQELLERDRSVALNLANHTQALCKYFGVSQQALEIRLDKLGIRTSGSRYGKRIPRSDDRVFDAMEQERQSWSFQGP